MNDKAEGHKYLEEVNADFFHYGMLNDDRQDKWQSERATYGFDSRETWCLDFAFKAWLYERLRMFSERNNIATESEYEVYLIDDEEVSLQKCLDTMIADCKFLMENDDFNEEYHPTFDRLLKYFTATIRSLWW